ncbi:MAG: MFS transporter [Proteobacteria bacterium]|nr:MAG: MFS transporter [Pseudomonadota bacterium]
MKDSSEGFSENFLLFLAFACGLIVANLYYNQPLLTAIRGEFFISTDQVGRIPMLTQLGYAAGMLLLTPLGDRYNRRGLILGASIALIGALLGAASAPSFAYFEAASFLIGLTAVGAQFIIPHVAHLTPDARRGAAVGKVFTGLLLGILLARTVSGFVGDLLGWRSMFYISAGFMVALTAALYRWLPGSAPTFFGSYGALLGSIYRIFREERTLRQCSLVGACIFAAFSAPWATLIFLLSGSPFLLGAKAAGTFGLLGAAGALAAGITGRFADRKGPLIASRVALAVAFFSFLALAVSGFSLGLLAIGFFLMDAGVQAAHVSNQARFYKLRPDARSRTNTAYMFFYFVGGAAGSYLGSLAWGRFGWGGVCLLSAGLTFVALVVALLAKDPPKAFTAV